MEKIILLKKEAVYGQDAAPTPAANAVLTRQFSARPIETDTLERNLDAHTRGRRRSANTNRRQTFSFELELAGAGAAGSAAPWMEVLEGCGMAAPVLTAGSKAEQRFAGAGVALSALTAHHWVQGERSRSTGCRGSMGLTFTAGAYPFLRLQFTGMPTTPAVDGTAPATAPDLVRWKEPVEVNTANTDFLLDGHALALRELTIDDGAQISVRNLVGENSIARGDHACTVRIRGTAPALGSKNFYSTLDSGAEVPMELVHGVTSGGMVGIRASYLQILGIQRVEQDDKLELDISAALNIRAGSDDLMLTAA